MERHRSQPLSIRRGRKNMGVKGKDIKIKASGGGQFDCYVVLPEITGKLPAVVLASAIHGVDADLRAIADDFAARGFIAAAPDLFWRSVPGPLARDDPRSPGRGQPRLEKIKAGEADMADTLAMLKTADNFNGAAMAMGFFYGGAPPNFRAQGGRLCAGVVWFRPPPRR